MRTVTHSVAINPFPGKGELTVLFAGHAQTAPLHKVGPQILDYHLLHFVLSGEGTFRCMGREYRLTGGSSFYIFPGELVSYASDEHNPWKYRWIGFKGDRADQLLSTLGISPHSPVVHTGNKKRLAALFHRIEHILREARPNCDLSSSGYLRLVLAEYAAGLPDCKPRQNETATGAQRQIEQAIRWLTLQYSQPVSIENMAQALGYHRTHLSRMFKRQTGMSPMKFLLKIRMERAKLLLHEPLTIEQVAASVGFADSLYFSKQFKKWYGCSPTEYRLMRQGKERFDCSQ